MPDNTRSADIVRQSYTFGDRRFIGINTNIQANNLEDGFVQDAVNLWNDGGALVVRPGWQAQLSSLTGLNSSYEPIAYRQPDNSSNFIIYAEGVAGSTTANIRKFVTGTNTQTSLGSITGDPSKVRMVQFGKYVYGVPGEGGGNVFRTDGTTLEVVPTVKPAFKNGTDLVTPKATVITTPIRPVAQVATSATLAASNSTITSTNSFVTNEPVVFAGSTDTVILPNTVYYIKSGVTSSTFQVSATAGGSVLTPATSGTYNVFSLRGIDNALSTGFDPAFISSQVATSVVTFATSGPAPVTCVTDVSTYVAVGSTVTFSGGTLPTNITAGVSYYVRSISGTAMSIGVAMTGGTLTPATTGSGTITATFYNAGATELITNTTTTTGYTFENDSAGSNPSTTFWTSASSPTAKTVSGIGWAGGSGNIQSYDSGTLALLLDGGSDSITSFNKVVPSYTYNGETKKTGLFVFKCVMFNNDTLTAPRNQSVRITVTGKDSSGTAINGAVFTQNISPAVASSIADWKAITVVIDFRTWVSSLSKISITLQTGNPSQSTTSDSRGVLVDNIGLWGIVDHVVPDVQNALDAQNMVNIRAKQVNDSVSPVAAGYIRGAMLRFSNLTKTDFTKEDTISLRMDFPTAIKTNLPYLSLGLLNTGATAPEWTGYGVYDQEKGYMTWKIYGISQAKRNNVQYIYVRCETEYTDVTNNSILFSIGELVCSGNLTPDTTYEYTFTRWYSSDQTNLRPPTYHEGTTYQTGLETLPSNVSNSITTTAAYSKASIVLNPQSAPACDLQWDTYPLVVSATPSEFVTDTIPASNQISVISTSAGTLTYTDSNGTAGRTVVLTANVPATLTYAIKNVTAFTGTDAVWLRHNPTYTSSASYKYSHILLYRRAAGVFPDGRFRLIAVIPISASSSGTNWSTTVSSVTTSGTWNEITFFDNVPDGDLFYEGAPYDQGQMFEPGREQFPNGCTSLAIHQKRLWVSKGNTVYGSWVLNYGNEYSLYTTLVPDVTDPNHDMKGTSFTLSSKSDNEKIVTLLSYGGDQMFFNNSTSAAMLVVRERSVYPLLGWDPSTFTIQSMITEAATGCTSPRAAMSVFGRLMWQSPIGVVEYTDGNIAPRSMELRKMLSLDKATGAPDLTPASYRNISYALHNGRLFIFAPGVGDSVNTYIYVYDTRTSGWTRWRTIPTTSTFETVPNSFVGFTGGVSMSFGNDQADFYAFGNNSQIYKLTGTNDMQDTTTTNQVYWSLTSRQYGQTYSEGIAYYNQNRVSQLDCHMYTGVGVTGVSGTYVGPVVTATNTFKANDLVMLSVNVVTNVAENTYYLISSATGSSFTVKTLAGGAITSSQTGSCTAVHGFKFNWAVQDETGTSKHGSGSWYVPINYNRTFGIRSLNRNTLATVMQINLYGWSNTAHRLYASHIHCADARIARSL